MYVAGGGSGCSGIIVAINLLFGAALLAAAAYMVVQGRASGNMGLR